MGRYPNYKEDSTRGRAIMAPKTYKGDTLVQVWLDRRMLATLSVWLEDNNVHTRFMSDVLRCTLEQVYNHLVDSGNVREFDTVGAGDYLSSKYMINLNPNGRGEKNLLHNMQLSERIKESIRPAIAPTQPVDVEENTCDIDIEEKRKEALEYLSKQREFREKLARIKNGEVLDKSPIVNNAPEKVISNDAGPAEPISDEEQLEKELDNARALFKKTGNNTEYIKIVNEMRRIKFSKNKKDSDVIRRKTNEELDREDEERRRKEKEFLESDMTSAALNK
jgi:hypothetical protein